MARLCSEDAEWGNHGADVRRVAQARDAFVEAGSESAGAALSVGGAPGGRSAPGAEPSARVTIGLDGAVPAAGPWYTMGSPRLRDRPR